MTQEEINGLLAEALDRAQERLNKQDEIIALLVGQIERMDYQLNGALAEAQNARQHYASARSKLGLSVDLSGGSLIGRDFGQPDG
jgi:phenylpyruvate tautomerase PptA (4-oxalocrotonate tautomerase family)